MKFFGKKVSHNKSVIFVLCILFGVSKKKALRLCCLMNLGLDCQFSEINTKDLSKLANILEKENILFDNKLKELLVKDIRSSKSVRQHVTLSQ